MFNKFKNDKIIIGLFIAICFVLFYKLGTYGVVETSEARYAEISRVMYLSGDYIHPYLMGLHHYHKPPITYQITSLGFRLFGINPFGARFFLQIALLLQLLLVYKLSYVLTGKKYLAIWASLIYFSFPIVLISIRNLTTDAYLNTFVLWAVYAWVMYKKSLKTRYLYIFTFSLALGFLTKGPVVFLVPLIFTLAYGFHFKQKLHLTKHHFFSWLFFFAVGFSWYLYLYTENNRFLNYFLEYQTFDRFTKNVFNRAEPFWYFIAFTPILGFPWFIFLIKNWIQKNNTINRKSLEFILSLSVLIPVLFFSLSSSKRMLYILPLYSLAAILIAIQLDKYKITKSTKFIIYGYATIILTCLTISPFLNLNYNFPVQISYFGFVGLTFLIYLFNTKKISLKSRLVLAPFISMNILLMGFPAFYSANESVYNPTKTISDFIKNKQLDKRTTIVYNRFKPSIAFDLNKSIISLNNGDNSLSRNRDPQFEKDTLWKKVLIDLRHPSELNYYKKLIEKPSVLIILNEEAKKDSLKWLLKPYPKVKIFEKWRVYY